MRARRVFVTLLLLVPALALRAADQTLLIELDRRSGALPSGVSAAGAVVVGSLGTDGFYWMPTTGTVFIGGRFAAKVSGDGRTIVGQASDAQGIENAAIWLRAAEWKLLGSFTPTAAPCGTLLSQATDTSGDGRVVVGYASNTCSTSHAFKWEESTGMVDLGSSFAGQDSLATGVSSDGRVVVGYQQDATGYIQGARWVDGRQERFTGPGGAVGAANATNRDGTIVVGRVCNGSATTPAEPGYQSAWVWTQQEGLRCLAVPALILGSGPPVSVEANATSDDGRVIVGGQSIGGSNDSNAVIWIDGSPMYLKDYLRANGVPNAFEAWINTGAITDMSPDGRILVGAGAAIGGFRGYIVILGEKP